MRKRLEASRGGSEPPGSCCRLPASGCQLPEAAWPPPGYLKEAQTILDMRWRYWTLTITLSEKVFEMLMMCF